MSIRSFALLLLGLCSCARSSEQLNVPYDDRFSAQTTLDLRFPADVGAAHAAVLLVHGGGWKEGAKEQLAGLAARLTQEGYLTASINYRLGPSGVYPLAVQDCRCALAFLEGHAEEFQAQPEKIAVLGHSAGGHLVSLISLSDVGPADCSAGAMRPPAAVIAADAPLDLTRLSWAADVQHFLGAKQEERPELYDEASPLAHVAAGAPPFLLIHGVADVYVPADHSLKMKDALEAAGNQADLLLLRGGGHVLNPGVSADQLYWEEYAVDSQEAWLALRDFLARTIGSPSR